MRQQRKLMLVKLVKSPLRYPGGKSRGLEVISKYLPRHFLEYREPFLGGGSVFFYAKQNYANSKYWLNDLNPELYCFWKIAQDNLDELVKAIKEVKENRQDGRDLFKELTAINPVEISNFDRAVRFFILNRITFSGATESGGFSQHSFTKRFTNSSIDRLTKIQSLFKEVIITNDDYSRLLEQEGKDVFIFLDPPYFSTTQSRLYGRKGKLHTNFDHVRFANLIQKCPHRWLITYDDCPEIRERFASAYIYDWELQYGMNNYKQRKAVKGKEIMITNYAVESSPHS